MAPGRKLSPSHLTATEDGKFFDIHGETFSIREGLKQRGARGMKTDEGFRWRFPNKAYPEVMEFLNSGASAGKIRLGDIDEIDPDQQVSDDEQGSDNEPEQQGVKYFSLAKNTKASTETSSDSSADLSEIKGTLSTILTMLSTTKNTSQNSSNSEDKATITRLQEELAATEQAVESAKVDYDRVISKLATFISMLEAKGDEKFTGEKLAGNLRKIK